MSARILAVTLLLLSAGGCRFGTNEEIDREAAQAVRSFGLSEVRMEGGYQLGSWLNSCDGRDSYARRFTAVNVQGQPVQGVACSGFFKGWTVRLTP